MRVFQQHKLLSKSETVHCVTGMRVGRSGPKKGPDSALAVRWGQYPAFGTRSLGNPNFYLKLWRGE